MPTRPHDHSHLAPEPRPQRKLAGLTYDQEQRLKAKLRKSTPSEPWVEEQIKSALDLDSDGSLIITRFRDRKAFPPGGAENTAMRRCPTCNTFTPPHAFEHDQCLDHANHDAWGPSPSSLAIQRFEIYNRRELFTELLPDDVTSLQREIDAFRHTGQISPESATVL